MLYLYDNERYWLVNSTSQLALWATKTCATDLFIMLNITSYLLMQIMFYKNVLICLFECVNVNSFDQWTGCDRYSTSDWRSGILPCLLPLGPQSESHWGAQCGLGFQSLLLCGCSSGIILWGFPPHIWNWNFLSCLLPFGFFTASSIVIKQMK